MLLKRQQKIFRFLTLIGGLSMAIFFVTQNVTNIFHISVAKADVPRPTSCADNLSDPSCVTPPPPRNVSCVIATPQYSTITIDEPFALEWSSENAVSSTITIRPDIPPAYNPTVTTYTNTGSGGPDTIYALSNSFMYGSTAIVQINVVASNGDTASCASYLNVQPAVPVIDCSGAQDSEGAYLYSEYGYAADPSCYSDSGGGGEGGSGC